MKLKFMPFLEESRRRISNAINATAIHTSAIAFAVANYIHIPTSPVDNPVSHFNLQLLSGINQELSEWNEDVIFDVRDCIEQIRMFWLLRYNAAHPDSRIMYSYISPFFDTMIGVNVLVSPEQQKFLDDNKADVLALSQVARAILPSKQ